jgi:predicted nucleic acid-binding protein
MKIFIDTGICVDVLRTNGPEKSVEVFGSLQDRNEGYVSVIAVAELSAGLTCLPVPTLWKRPRHCSLTLNSLIALLWPQPSHRV